MIIYPIHSTEIKMKHIVIIKNRLGETVYSHVIEAGEKDAFTHGALKVIWFDEQEYHKEAAMRLSPHVVSVEEDEVH